eukprot:Partr_v1_DN27893_c0_g1_i1_m23063 putative Pyroglutamyl-peptidase
MWILVTGYEAFGNIGKNPSWLAVDLLPDTIRLSDGDSCSIVRLKFRVVYSDIDDFYKTSFATMCDDRESKPAMIIHCGVATDSQTIRLEKFAYNLSRGLDVLGKCPEGPIDEMLPLDSTLPSKLNLKAAADMLSSQGLHTRVSTDPGRFLCNYVFYQALRISDIDSRVVFFHVPPENRPRTIRRLALAISI